LQEWANLPWTAVIANMVEMTEKMDTFGLKMKKLPGRLRDWEAFKQLRQKVEDFQTILPLLQELSKESIKKRHWEDVCKCCKSDVEVTDDFPGSLPLSDILKIDMVAHKEEVEEITDGAGEGLLSARWWRSPERSLPDAPLAPCPVQTSSGRSRRS
jgi:dynein heavy chain, axonemal